MRCDGCGSYLSVTEAKRRDIHGTPEMPLCRPCAEWEPPNPEHLRPTRWGWMVSYPEHLTVGRYTDIGAFTYINARSGVELKERVEIGSHCSIYSSSSIDGRWGKVTLEAGACLGSHSTVMPDVTIGSGAIVGAHSLVLEDVEPGAVVFGAPATVHKEAGTP